MQDDEHDSAGSTINAAVHAIAVQLARAVLAGPMEAAALRARFVHVFGQRLPWLTPLARHILLDFGSGLSSSQHDELVANICTFQPLRDALARPGQRPGVRGWYPYSPPMGTPPLALAAIHVPPLATPGDIARWLDLDDAALNWFCDFMRSDNAAPDALRHYRHRWIEKRRGGHRLLEIPKPRLRSIQRRILDEILAKVPPHSAAHGCVRRRSSLSASAPHAGARVVLRIDLEDFFAGIGVGRIQALFRTLGYPPAAAKILAQLVTHVVPSHVLRMVAAHGIDQQSDEHSRLHRKHAALRARHLPQGAPSSPSLANLCAYRLDVRLAGAAASCGASYTRYVDDLIFSGGETFAGGWRRFERMVYSIILEEGFTPNYHKTRVCSQGGSQQVLGLVVNRHLNISRHEYDRLKAVLHNCVRFGPQSQNRGGHPAFRAHLLGRIARVAEVNPPRAARLTASFRQIVWT